MDFRGGSCCSFIHSPGPCARGAGEEDHYDDLRNGRVFLHVAERGGISELRSANAGGTVITGYVLF